MQRNANPNALIRETSPYLLQHAYNPVDWMPWGESALAKARADNKLIFVSIGYAACHWCHVMEHESFEDEQVAAALNQSFVSIKVDREERPDLDEIYMTATMLYTGGHGGWPMSVFLAPDLRPVYAGTYFPKDNAYGRPGFLSVLKILSDRWREDPDSLTAESDKVIEIIRQNHVSSGGGAIVEPQQIRAGAQRVHDAFDRNFGGLPSGGNRFPPAQAMELLLRVWRHGQDPRLLSSVELTLEKMGQGGIYDHLGGGVHRYSTDPKWLVPHFEKMLYDQGLVAAIYADGYQAAGSEELRTLCRERALGICDYVLRDLTHPDGGFYSSEDADSEGLEGSSTSGPATRRSSAWARRPRKSSGRATSPTTATGCIRATRTCRPGRRTSCRSCARRRRSPGPRSFRWRRSSAFSPRGGGRCWRPAPSASAQAWTTRRSRAGTA